MIGSNEHNSVAALGLVSLLAVAYAARAWLGSAHAGQIDPIALGVSATAVGACLLFVLPRRATSARSKR